MNNDRFKSLPWVEQASLSSSMCTVGGAGGISSWTTLFLSRAGFRICIYDADTIEEHNIGGQFFKTTSIGLQKVTALSHNIREFCGKTLISNPVMFDKDSLISPIALCGFDNMTARKDFYRQWKKLDSGIYIDGRLRAEQFEIFTIRHTDKDRMEIYEAKHLFNDSEVEPELCSAKQTSHVAAMIGTMMVSILTNHLSNIADNNMARNVPFRYEAFTPLMMFTDGY